MLARSFVRGFTRATAAALRARGLRRETVEVQDHGVTATTRLGVARVSVFASTTDATLDMFRDACLSYATMQ